MFVRNGYVYSLNAALSVMSQLARCFLKTSRCYRHVTAGWSLLVLDVFPLHTDRQTDGSCT